MIKFIVILAKHAIGNAEARFRSSSYLIWIRQAREIERVSKWPFFCAQTGGSTTFVFKSHAVVCVIAFCCEWLRSIAFFRAPDRFHTLH